MDYVKHTNADLLIVASQGKSAVGRQLFGSTVDTVLHNVCCPIMVYKDKFTNCGAKRKEDAVERKKQHTFSKPH